jgi:hypothetical protein
MGRSLPVSDILSDSSWYLHTIDFGRDEATLVRLGGDDLTRPFLRFPPTNAFVTRWSPLRDAANNEAASNQGAPSLRVVFTLSLSATTLFSRCLDALWGVQSLREPLSFYDLARALLERGDAALSARRSISAVSWFLARPFGRRAAVVKATDSSTPVLPYLDQSALLGGRLFMFSAAHDFVARALRKGRQAWLAARFKECRVECDHAARSGSVFADRLAQASDRTDNVPERMAAYAWATTLASFAHWKGAAREDSTLLDLDFQAAPAASLARAARLLALETPSEPPDPGMLTQLMGIHAKQDVPYRAPELDHQTAEAGVNWLSNYLDVPLLLEAVRAREPRDSGSSTIPLPGAAVADPSGPSQ